MAGEIRPFERRDLDAVAALLAREFPAIARGDAALFRACLRNLYLDGPFHSPAMPSLVYEREPGLIAGFIGVTAQPMIRDGARIHAAICGALAVQDHAGDPFASVRLLKRFLAGPQDVSLSETAGEASLAIWRQLGGATLSRHSLEWVRVFRPAGLLVETAASRLPLAGLLAWPARAVDQWRSRRRPGKAQRWTKLPDEFRGKADLTIIEADPAAFADQIRAHARRFALAPEWTDAALAGLVSEAACKNALGAERRCLIAARSGAVLGGFLYHMKPDRTARVVQILAASQQVGAVIDHLFADAAGRGAVAMRGRTDPLIMDALQARRCLMFHTAASVIHARHASLIADFQGGQGWFNGLVGEGWTRLIGDDFTLAPSAPAPFSGDAAPAPPAAAMADRA